MILEPQGKGTVRRKNIQALGILGDKATGFANEESEITIVSLTSQAAKAIAMPLDEMEPTKRVSRAAFRTPRRRRAREAQEAIKQNISAHAVVVHFARIDAAQRSPSIRTLEADHDRRDIQLHDQASVAHPASSTTASR